LQTRFIDDKGSQFYEFALINQSLRTNCQQPLVILLRQRHDKSRHIVNGESKLHKRTQWVRKRSRTRSGTVDNIEAQHANSRVRGLFFHPWPLPHGECRSL